MRRGPLAGDGVAGRVLIPRRFNGPPASANGGYTCGLVARHIRGPAEVSLRSPPPLDTALELGAATTARSCSATATLLVAEGRPPSRPTSSRPCGRPWPQAREALRRHPWPRGRHPFSECYVCGAGRHDGLGLHFGDLRGQPAMTAALLVADETVPHDAPASCRRSRGARWTARATCRRCGRPTSRACSRACTPSCWSRSRSASRSWHRLAAGREGASTTPRRRCWRPTGACSPAPRHLWIGPRARGGLSAASAPRGRSGRRAWIAIHSAAPTTSSSRATSPAGGQTIAKRPPWARTSDAAPSSARRPGRVAEVDVGQVDEQRGRRHGAAAVEPRAQLRRRRDVELAGHGYDANARLVTLHRRVKGSPTGGAVTSPTFSSFPTRRQLRFGVAPASSDLRACLQGFFFGLGFGQHDVDASRSRRRAGRSGPGP